MSTRILKPRVRPSTTLVPSAPHEWDNLLRRVMARASQTHDRRLQGMADVISRGQSQQYLRRLGIVTEADILREFPNRKT